VKPSSCGYVRYCKADKQLLQPQHGDVFCSATNSCKPAFYKRVTQYRCPTGAQQQTTLTKTKMTTVSAVKAATTYSHSHQLRDCGAGAASFAIAGTTTATRTSCALHVTGGSCYRVIHKV
jgi:hypothetical protein